MSDKKQNIDRRNFLKILGGGAAVTATSLVGCSPTNTARGGVAVSDIPKDKMTYRTNTKTGDEVSILGYGMMRLPTRAKVDGSGDEVIQETVNELVDYAIDHGVNFFDTAPPYVQGLSEEATGQALSRHPRAKYFACTKLSNHRSASLRQRQNSITLYENSMTTFHGDSFAHYNPPNCWT